MKQIWPNYSYSPTTNVLTLTGLNIDRDQLLLVSAPERGRIMYNFADSSVTASAFTAGANTGLTLVASTAGLTTTAALVIYYDDQLTSSTVTVSSLPVISGTVTANLNTIQESAFGAYDSGSGIAINQNLLSVRGFDAALFLTEGGGNVPISGTVTVGNTVTIAGTVTANPTGTQTIAGSVTLGAGTSQIGSVTASISGTVPISISSVTVGNSVTIGSLPAISGTVTANLNSLNFAGGDGDLVPFAVQIGFFDDGLGEFKKVSSSTTPLPISGTVTANTFAIQGTAVTTSNFTSTTASTVLANYNATREVLTIFNEGAGNLHIAPGATCTTIAYQVRLSAGDYYEVPNHQTTITHSAVFATAGTARIVQIS